MLSDACQFIHGRARRILVTVFLEFRQERCADGYVCNMAVTKQGSLRRKRYKVVLCSVRAYIINRRVFAPTYSPQATSDSLCKVYVRYKLDITVEKIQERIFYIS